MSKRGLPTPGDAIATLGRDEHKRRWDAIDPPHGEVGHRCGADYKSASVDAIVWTFGVRAVHASQLEGSEARAAQKDPGSMKGGEGR